MINLAITYTIFCIVATIVNLGIQEFVINVYKAVHALEISIVCGTLAGLVVKYILDKKYIFKAHTKGVNRDIGRFFLYALMGIVTTLIFWAFEFGFHYVFDNKFMRYTGAVIGLTIGYVFKYYLDARFVFNK